jgi:hypothetical protein
MIGVGRSDTQTKGDEMTKKQRAELVKLATEFANWLDGLTDRELRDHIRKHMNLTVPLCEAIRTGIALPTGDGAEWVLSGYNVLLAYKADKVICRELPERISGLTGITIPPETAFEWPWMTDEMAAYENLQILHGRD